MTIAIDCGANLGVVTKKLVEKYDEVWAFEPNPYAYRKLCKECLKFKNLNIINAAVVSPKTESSLVTVFFDKRAVNDDDTKTKYSQATSIYKKKRNVNDNDYKKVLAVNFSEFLRSFDYVDYIKMDVEGAEYDILIDVIKSGLIKRIGKIDVELHALRAPETFGAEHGEYLKVIKEYNVNNIGVHH